MGRRKLTEGRARPCRRLQSTQSCALVRHTLGFLGSGQAREGRGGSADVAANVGSPLGSTAHSQRPINRARRCLARRLTVAIDRARVQARAARGAIPDPS
uniref:Uncharacterized protein n=1 Tax=Plectus sambesii TaxID=2011161 RepID=A0A914VLP5_9BILA